MMNLAGLAWDDSLLEAFNIPRAVLPKIVPSSDVYGTAQIEALRDVPVAGILGDQQAALVGQTCFAEGEAKNTYGTGCFLLMNIGTKPRESTAGLITTVAYQFGSEPAHYALEGSIAITGALVQWLRDNLGMISSSTEVEKLPTSRSRVHNIDDYADGLATSVFGNKVVDDLLLDDGLFVGWEQRLVPTGNNKHYHGLDSLGRLCVFIEQRLGHFQDDC